jgi:benzoyl-CoA reductase/2-hydroxyglutaryl-CoA dehydratase subunit BcrC/BadD/HgdB
VNEDAERVLEQIRAVDGLPIAGWRKRFPGCEPVGIYNAYVPVEMFHAAGLTPVYLFHRAEDRGYARAHLPAFTCWPGRSLVDQAMAGDLEGLAGLALGQTCDTVQALVDVGRVVMPSHIPVYHIGVPQHLATPAARPYFLRELKRLRAALGSPSDQALVDAIDLCNQTRRQVRALYARAPELAPPDLCAALRAALTVPPDRLHGWLAVLLDTVLPGKTSGPRLILVGPHLADPILYHVIDEAGARVVDDLLDVGHRYFAGAVASDGDPVEALADHYLALSPTPTKHHPGRRRDQGLVDMVSRRYADGVIFARQKFCDPHGFDHVPLKAALETAGVPTLSLELEQAPQGGQLRTRVQAFVEMVGGEA